MNITLLRHGALPQLGYFIECNGEAAVIDPPAHILQELRELSRNNIRIKYALSTKFQPATAKNQAELKKAVSANVIFGSTAFSNNVHNYAIDNDEFQVGDCWIRVLHTPGHSQESTCYLLLDKFRKPSAVFTGNTFLINSTGYPDYHTCHSVPSWETAAHQLYDSIVNKLALLPDDVTIYPGRSFIHCWQEDRGFLLSDSLQNQKKVNPVLSNSVSWHSFRKLMIAEFSRANPQKNFTKNGNNEYNGISPVTLSANEFISLLKITGALVVDLRNHLDFTAAFIPGSLFLDAKRSHWLDLLVPDKNQSLLLLTPKGTDIQARQLFSARGFSNILGVCTERIEELSLVIGSTLDKVVTVSAQDFTAIVRRQGVEVLDVRAADEYHLEHFAGSYNIPLEFASWKVHNLDMHRHYYIYGTKDYRAIIFISFLKILGFRRVTEITGGLLKLRTETLLHKNRFIIRDELL